MRLRHPVLLLLPLLGPAQVFGLGIRIADQDPFATARGNAFAATANNPSAIYYNPAGITQLEGNNFRLGTYGIYIDTDYDSPPGSRPHVRIDNDEEIQALPQFYYTYRHEKCPITLGLG